MSYLTLNGDISSSGRKNSVFSPPGSIMDGRNLLFLVVGNL